MLRLVRSWFASDGSNQTSGSASSENVGAPDHSASPHFSGHPTDNDEEMAVLLELVADLGKCCDRVQLALYELEDEMAAIDIAAVDRRLADHDKRSNELQSSLSRLQSDMDRQQKEWLGTVATLKEHVKRIDALDASVATLSRQLATTRRYFGAFVWIVIGIMGKTQLETPKTVLGRSARACMQSDNDYRCDSFEATHGSCCLLDARKAYSGPSFVTAVIRASSSPRSSARTPTAS